MIGNAHRESRSPAPPPTRRQFLRTSSLATAGAFGISSRSWASGRPRADTVTQTSHHLEDPDLNALARRALAAAISAGASYADIRFTRTRRQQFSLVGVRDSDLTVAGVRALVKGVWGFAAHAEITPEGMTWIGTTAATLGQANAWEQLPPITLGEYTPSVGTWTTPVVRDPFTVSLAEKEALFLDIGTAVLTAGGTGFNLQANFERQERMFVSTEGTSIQQTVYTTGGMHARNRAFSPTGIFGVRVKQGRRSISYPSSLVSPTGKGYEALSDLMQDIPQMVERARALMDATPMDAPGRYEVVFDGYAVASLVNALGISLDIDRVLGYEAMTGGTSYLAPLTQVFGTPLFPASVSITADRTMCGGAATVNWDDEGIATHAFPLIQSGVLTDCNTGREFLPEVAAWYERQQRLVRSHGCMSAEHGKLMPLIQTPNLTLTPSASNTDFDALLSGITNGFAVFGGDLNMDQQFLTGSGSGAITYAVKNGKLAGVVDGASYFVRMPDIWKQLVGLGGPGTAVTRGFSITKGQPQQIAAHSVRAVAARFKDVAIRGSGARKR